MHNLLKYVLLLFLHMTTCIAASMLDDDFTISDLKCCSDENVPTSSGPLYLLTLQRNQGRSIGNNSSFTSLGSFSFPFYFQTFKPFLDLKCHCFGNGQEYAANAGLGLRASLPCFDQIFGVNAYYDFRHFRHIDFNQVGLGLEMLGCTWNFRLNGYLPVGKKRGVTGSCFFNKYIGGFFVLREEFTSSLKGANFEIEAFIKKLCWGDIYLTIGGYYYQRNKCQKNIHGTEYRISFKNCKFGIFSLVTTHDNAFKTRVEVQWTLMFPLNCKCIEDPILFQPVRRHDLIVSDKYNLWTRNF